jgi:hypothetical protein
VLAQCPVGLAIDVSIPETFGVSPWDLDRNIEVQNMTETGEVVHFNEQLGAFLYDVGAPAVFFPLGGIGAMREKTLDA